MRRDELQDDLLTAPQIPMTTNLEILRRHIAETIQRGDQAQVKQLINARDHPTPLAAVIEWDPDFRAEDPVRQQYESV